jgi:hypothetical protein
MLVNSGRGGGRQDRGGGYPNGSGYGKSGVTREGGAIWFQWVFTGSGHLSSWGYHWFFVSLPINSLVTYWYYSSHSKKQNDLMVIFKGYSTQFQKKGLMQKGWYLVQKMVIWFKRSVFKKVIKSKVLKVYHTVQLQKCTFSIFKWFKV